MVVSTDGKTFGKSEENIRVVSPLMVQSQLPRSLNVSDKVEVPVSLFRDEQSIDAVSIAASSSNTFLSFDRKNISTNFGNEDQKIETITFSTGDESGTTDILFNANASAYLSLIHI